ncbi:MAG TPA: hypothetical protein PK095_16675 [Myxococcota bacterium]|nr:hypothetical protein [Myxococcota bacterium]
MILTRPLVGKARAIEFSVGAVWLSACARLVLGDRACVRFPLPGPFPDPLRDCFQDHTRVRGLGRSASLAAASMLRVNEVFRNKAIRFGTCIQGIDAAREI